MRVSEFDLMIGRRVGDVCTTFIKISTQIWYRTSNMSNEIFGVIIDTIYCK